MKGYKLFTTLITSLKISIDNPLILQTIYELAISCDNYEKGGPEPSLLDFTERYKQLHDNLDKHVTELEENFSPEQIKLILKTLNE